MLCYYLRAVTISQECLRGVAGIRGRLLFKGGSYSPVYGSHNGLSAFVTMSNDGNYIEYACQRTSSFQECVERLIENDN